MTFPSAKSQFYSNDSFECIITYIQNLNVNFSFNRSLLPCRFFDYMQNCSRYENRNVHYLGSGDSIEIPRIEWGVGMDTNKSTAVLCPAEDCAWKNWAASLQSANSTFQN